VLDEKVAEHQGQNQARHDTDGGEQEKLGSQWR
jgi:hypothetical protein